MNRTQGRRAGHPAGRTAAIRPAATADRPALSDFFAGLSAQTRYLRFFAPVHPGAAMLGLLSGQAANADAMVAVDGPAIIGHALAVDRAEPGPTDIGVVVADAWQGQGVGSALTRALLGRAQARGATSAAMDVLPGNHRVLAMIASHWPVSHVEHSPDCTTICVSLLLEAPQYLQAEAGHHDLGPGLLGLVPGAGARGVEVGLP